MARADNLLTGSIIGTSGSFNNGGNTKEKAMDGDTTTFFDGPTANSNWVGLNMSGQLPKQVTSVRYFPRSGQAARMTGGIFQGANSVDFTNAMTLATISSQPAGGVYTTQIVSVTNAFSYIRYFSPNNSSGNVAELQFYGLDLANPGAPAATASLVASASDSQVALTWNAVAGAASYKIKRALTNAVGPFSVIATGVTTTNFTDTTAINGALHFYRVVAVNANEDGPDSVSVTALPLAIPTFGIFRQLWTGLSSAPGNVLGALTNTTYNPNWPNQPNTAKIFTNFETEVNSGINNYGQRARALLVPPLSGAYRFWIASDDASALFLSSDENPANIVSIAGVVAWTSSREWAKEANQQSALIPLEAGRRYYLEAQMMQGTGGDNLAVRWQLPGALLEEPMRASSSAGTKLIPWLGLDALPGIFVQPTNTTVVEGQGATFSLLATNQSALNYAWTLSGTNIPGAAATHSVYGISNAALAFNGLIYRCVLSNAVGVVTSAPVTLSVLVDTNPPTVTRIFNIGPTNLQVIFSEPLELSSATNLANYNFTNGIGISRASLATDNLSLMLTTTPLTIGATYALFIHGVRDRASNPNPIANNTVATFTATPYASQDLGNPSSPSVTAFTTNGISVTTSGFDIGAYADQAAFNYLIRTGDFDVAVRVAGLLPSDVWAKAGLMARETLDAGSRFAASLATPAMNGAFFEYRDPAGGSAISAGTFPANYPNTWLRLHRSGNVFTGYASYDGLIWAALSSATIGMPPTIFLGFVASGHSATQPTFAQLSDFKEVTNAVVGIIPNPHEPNGPSTRKSPIAISEIMYKPASRADTNNTEFVELYNSNPWFHDISGYRLVADNFSYTIPANTILQGGAYLVIAASPASMLNVYGITNMLGPYGGSLKKSGQIQLLDEQGAVLLSIPYSNQPPWPAAADGTGHSLALANASYGEEDPRAWDISDVVGGSPGQMEAFRPNPLRNVVINEFLAHTDPPDYDYIELYNHATQPVDISGCILSDDFTTNKFVIPAGTILPPGGFIAYFETNMNFALNAAGETIYFKNPNQSRCLDCVRFDAQENGVATGRWPDGAEQFYRLAGKTPGSANAAIRLPDVVINELMYQPITGNDDDQFVELYNRGSNTVNLTGWRLEEAVSFSFPSNTVLFSDHYLVVGRNAARLRTNYANLNFANCLGDFNGKLGHNGDHLALTMSDTVVSTNGAGVVSTNTIHITVNDVTYGTGGRWGQWAAGGGSSLELIDPNANTRLAANWADSDDTQKSSWVTNETIGVLDNGGNFDSFIDYAQIGLLDAGECLIDDIEVRAGTTGTNLVMNPDFESGTGNWTFQGDHFRSAREPGGFGGGYALHMRASGRLWTAENSCQVMLYTNSLARNQTATLRFKARWLRGWPEALLRIHGNWLETTGPLPVPTNLGTPGARNSQFVGNAGPAVYAVTHAPSLPSTGQAAVVTARVHDPDGVQSVTLYYRIDPSLAYTAVSMKDDGTGADLLAGDGLFSASIPGQPAGTVIAFYIAATDTKGGSSRFPKLKNDNTPDPEGVIMFGDVTPTGSFATYHLWITQTNATRWAQLLDLSNESHDSTFVNGPRVIYNMQGRFSGSPYKQGFDTPYGATCAYKWTFPDDDKLLGATSFNKLHPPGNGPGGDNSLQREQIVNSFMRTLGVPWLYKRMVAVYVNGNRRNVLLEDTQVPDNDFIKEYFPDDKDGWLYKMQPWFEFRANPGGGSLAFSNAAWCTLNNYTTTGGLKKRARYRYNYEIRKTPVSCNDFTNVFSLIDAANAYGKPQYAANLQNLADMENWMRVFAANHAAGNWDSFGSQNAQNLFVTTGGDPWMSDIYQEPVFRRMYWRALEELVNGPLNTANSGPLIDGKYQAFVASGLAAEDPNSAIKPWMTQAHDSIASQLAAENTNNYAVTSVVVSNNVAIVSGTAPVVIKSILFNGVAWPITWTSLMNWKVTIPLQTGTNQTSVVGVDIHGSPYPGASNNIAPVYNGTQVSPAGALVINEIMYNPAVAGAEFVELYNTSSNTTFDVSGCDFHGLAYTFPPGSLIGPNSFLTLAANNAAFAAAYGATNAVFGNFSGTLSTDGEMLSLIRPGTNSASDVTIAKVRFSNTAPWPITAAGISLQLVDPRQDNWRAGNWLAAVPTPTASNSVQKAIATFPPLWLNELQADNLTGVTNRAGQRVPWLELYNPTTNVVALSNIWLANSYTNLAQWSFPSNATLNPGQFRVVFADGLTNLSTANELHANFSLPSGAGSLAMTRLSTNAQLQVLDFISYAGVGLDHSYGSFPDGQSFDRQEFFYATPGSTNNGTSAPLKVYINEWMAENTQTLADPADGHFDDWFELYNPGTNAVDLSGYYLTDTISNKFQFLIPNNHQYTIAPHGFLLVWADNDLSQNVSNRSDLHANFKLSKSGEAIGLFAPDGTAIDYITFDAQTADVSMGRYPDGSANIVIVQTASPRAANLPPNTAPSILFPGNKYLYPGETLSFTLQASDPDVPSQTLLWSLDPGAPTNVVLNAASGEISWTPSPSQIPSTNTLNVRVTDNGIPPLQGTQSFSIAAVAAAPRMSVVSLSGNSLSFAWQSVPGRSYRIQYKDQLDSSPWNNVSPDQAGNGGTLNLTISTSYPPRRFYRVLVVP